ncbi:MAG: peptidylprolyl isomerase [Bacteroidetes bacterium]|nr:peptidylprolyl isomerase [Rhodothermia bacterium]MCS7155463.1 peptidylprolyl isomerase [Bacteroidota bacterium]MCX7907444.1 peptidylprolyl isomerase [Bacteroidota bacterium]MDW8138438.1 peptidylprolyl isomerase [Bacteroidota bacterium]MDW8284625.1 peptidylprolyl isomerase [Bacteroidota bacterium]
MRTLLTGVLLVSTALRLWGQNADPLLDVLRAQDARHLPTLLAVLEHPEPRVRARAAFALASLQDTVALPALGKALEDPHPEVRQEAAFALGQLFSARAAGALWNRLLQEPSSAVRATLLEAIGKCADAVALGQLVRWTPPEPADTVAWLWAIARAGLRGVSSPEAARAALGGLAHPHPEARRAAAYYFSRAPLGAWSEQAPLLWRILESDTSGPEEATGYLVRALGRLVQPEDRHRLVRVLKHPDWRVRVETVRALAQIQPFPWEEVSRALGDRSAHVRLVALEALAEAPGRAPESMLALLRARLREPQLEPWERGTLLVALAAHAPAEALRIAQALHRIPHPFLQARLAEALSRIEHPEARTRLLRSWRIQLRASGSAVVRNALFTALRRQREAGWLPAPQALELYREALLSRDLALMTLAAQAAASDTLLGRRLVPELLRLLESLKTPQDVEPMEALIRALVRLRAPEAVSVLEPLSRDPSPVIAHLAASGIAALTGRAVSAPRPSPLSPVYQAEEVFPLLGRRPRVAIKTPRGELIVELYPDQAPFTVWNFLQLARSGRLDGVPFHRVVSNFVVQGGDFRRGDGWGGPDYAIRSEFGRLRFERGTVGMASAGKDTEGSQYFICHSAQPHLDGRYTAFGRVLTGLEALDRILPGDLALRVYLIAE